MNKCSTSRWLQGNVLKADVFAATVPTPRLKFIVVHNVKWKRTSVAFSIRRPITHIDIAFLIFDSFKPFTDLTILYPYSFCDYCRLSYSLSNKRICPSMLLIRHRRFNCYKFIIRSPPRLLFTIINFFHTYLLLYIVF